jgi:hypothetical protein
MLWKEYYDKQVDWADSTKVNRISKLESFGSPDEVAEVIVDIAFYNEAGATRLLKKAIAAGVKFTGEQLFDFIGCCEEEVFLQAIQFSADQFTTKDLDDLYTACDDEILVEIALKYQIQLPDCLADYGIKDFGYLSIKELIAEYDYILECLHIAHNHLQEARTYSLWDISRKHREWSVLKYSHVEDAQNYITDAINTWNRLEFPGKDKSLFPKVFPCISTSDMWCDFWIEGFWMELIAKQRIQTLKKAVEQAIRAIQTLRSAVQHPVK